MHERLRAFASVAHHGTLRAAAAELFVTQPTLTARIAALEADLGVRLFVRSSKGMRLTEEGRAFLPHAERAMESVEQGRRLLARISAGSAGDLSMAVAPAVGSYILPAALTRFTRDRPDVEVSVRTAHSEEILQLVLRDDVSLGVVRDLTHPDVRRHYLFSDELVLVTEPGHPFALAGRVRVEQLARERLITFDRTSSFHHQTSSAFMQAGIQPRTVMELDNIHAAKRMVVLGLGVSLLPYSAVASEVESGALAAVLIAGAAPMTREIVAIARRDAGELSGVQRAFLDCLRQAAPGRPTLDDDPVMLAEAFRLD